MPLPYPSGYSPGSGKWADAPADFPEPLSRSSSYRLGRTGVGIPGISVTVNVGSLVKIIDTEAMKFRSSLFYQALVRANEEAAEKIKRGMVDELERQMNAKSGPKRPQRPGKRLATSLMSDRNHEISPNHMMVGRPAWLDESPAGQYWRAIEEGQPTRFNVPLLFTNDFRKWEAPWSAHGADWGNSWSRNRGSSRGYPHMRATQWARRGVTVDIGPFPEYHFSRGGHKVARAMDWRALYRRHLSGAGFNVSDVFKSRGRVTIG